MSSDHMKPSSRQGGRALRRLTMALANGVPIVAVAVGALLVLTVIWNNTDTAPESVTPILGTSPNRGESTGSVIFLQSNRLRRVSEHTSYYSTELPCAPGNWPTYYGSNGGIIVVLGRQSILAVDAGSGKLLFNKALDFFIPGLKSGPEPVVLVNAEATTCYFVAIPQGKQRATKGFALVHYQLGSQVAASYPISASGGSPLPVMLGSAVGVFDKSYVDRLSASSGEFTRVFTPEPDEQMKDTPCSYTFVSGVGLIRLRLDGKVSQVTNQKLEPRRKPAEYSFGYAPLFSSMAFIRKEKRGLTVIGAFSKPGAASTDLLALDMTTGKIAWEKRLPFRIGRIFPEEGGKMLMVNATRKAIEEYEPDKDLFTTKAKLDLPSQETADVAIVAVK